MTDHLDPDYGLEHRRRRESRRWPYAFFALLGGLMLGVLIVLAVRGPSTVIVQGSACCCCGSPCAPGEVKPKAGAPRTGDSTQTVTPALPPPERGSYPPTNDHGPQLYGWTVPPIDPLPRKPDNPAGENGGETRTAKVPTEGTLALMGIGLAALAFRLS